MDKEQKRGEESDIRRTDNLPERTGWKAEVGDHTAGTGRHGFFLSAFAFAETDNRYCSRKE